LKCRAVLLATVALFGSVVDDISRVRQCTLRSTVRCASADGPGKRRRGLCDDHQRRDRRRDFGGKVLDLSHRGAGRLGPRVARPLRWRSCCSGWVEAEAAAPPAFPTSPSRSPPAREAPFRTTWPRRRYLACFWLRPWRGALRHRCRPATASARPGRSSTAWPGCRGRCGWSRRRAQPRLGTPLRSGARVRISTSWRGCRERRQGRKVFL
jgi:hypothetical protein